MISPEVARFCDLGPLPAMEHADPVRMAELGAALHAIKRPIADEEALQLVDQFGPDECYGLAWTLLHLIETAPGWPIEKCLTVPKNEWQSRLKRRATHGKR